MSSDTIQDKKVTIVYTTIKNSTKKVANHLKQIFEENQIQATIFNADKSDKTEILESI